MYTEDYNKYRKAFQEKGLIAVPVKGTTTNEPDKGKEPYCNAKYKRFTSYHSFKERPFTEEEMNYYFSREKGEIGLGVVLGKIQNKDDLFLIGFDVDKMVSGTLADFCDFCVDNGLAFERSARKGVHVYGYSKKAFPDTRGITINMGNFVVSGDLWGNGSMYFVTAPTKILEGVYVADSSLMDALFLSDFNYYPETFLSEFERGTHARAEQIKKYVDVKVDSHDVDSFFTAYSQNKISSGERHDFLLAVCKDIYKRVYTKKSTDEAISLAFSVLKKLRDEGILENSKDKKDAELRDIATYCYGYRKQWEESVSTPEFKKIIENYKLTGSIPDSVDNFKQKYIKSLMKKGFSLEDHKAAVEEVATLKRGLAKLDDKEQRVTLKKISMLQSYIYNLAFERILCDRPHLKYDKTSNRFYEYNEKIGIYEEVEPKVFESEIMNHLATYGLDSLVTRNKAQDVIARILFHCPTFTPSRNEYLTCVGNGILNIKTNELTSFSPDFITTTRIKTNYNPDVIVEGSRFERFMSEIMVGQGGQIRLMKQFTGYLLSPSTKYQKALIMVGEGSNGKSVYTRILKELVGSAGYSVMKAEALNTQFGVSQLINKRVNICDETSGKYLDSHILKSLISGEDQLCDVKYKNQIHFTPEVKIIMTVNDLPAISDTSFGFYRRFIQVEMLGTFTAENGNLDTNLYEILKGESEIILKWALEGYQDLEKEGDFSIEERNTELLKEYRMENDITTRFVGNVLEPSPSDFITIADAYQEYKAYCSRMGKSAKHIGNFSKDIQRVDGHGSIFVYEKRKNGHDGAKITGVKINPEWLTSKYSV